MKALRLALATGILIAVTGLGSEEALWWLHDQPGLLAGGPASGHLLPDLVGAGGEGQNRTADTTIFSRVLCQLSYLARGGATLPGC